MDNCNGRNGQTGISQSYAESPAANRTHDAYNDNTSSELWINAKTTTATTIQAEINQQKEDLPLTEQIPKEYHQYLDVFDENKAERFPES